MYDVWGFNDECYDMWYSKEFKTKEEAVKYADNLQKESPHCHYEVTFDIDVVVYNTKRSGKMKRYKVEMFYVKDVIVEANNEGEALKKAYAGDTIEDEGLSHCECIDDYIEEIESEDD